MSDQTPTRTTADTVRVGDTLNRIDQTPLSRVHERPYDAVVLEVQRETHDGVEYVVLVLTPQAPARSSLVRAPLDRGVTVTRA